MDSIRLAKIFPSRKRNCVYQVICKHKEEIRTLRRPCCCVRHGGGAKAVPRRLDLNATVFSGTEASTPKLAAKIFVNGGIVLVLKGRDSR